MSDIRRTRSSMRSRSPWTTSLIQQVIEELGVRVTHSQNGPGNRILLNPIEEGPLHGSSHADDEITILDNEVDNASTEYLAIDGYHEEVYGDETMDISFSSSEIESREVQDPVVVAFPDNLTRIRNSPQTTPNHPIDLTQIRDPPQTSSDYPVVSTSYRSSIAVVGRGTPPKEFPNVDSSQVDFRTPLKKTHNKKRSPEDKRKFGETADESEICTICFESWTTSGRHRLVCLKCGHLYGQECIEKWLDSQDTGSCPQCNAKASKKDIRCLYARKLMAVDNCEIEQLKKDLNEERTTRRKTELDLGLMRLRWHQTDELCKQLKQELNLQREMTQLTSRQVEIDSTSQGVQSSGRYVIEKIFTTDVGGGRALACNCVKSYLCASQGSPSFLYPGFGVKKLSTLDFKTQQYIPLHSKQIRDLSFHPTLEKSLLLSCAIDKKVKVTSMDSLETVQIFPCTSPIWSCTWSNDNLNHFFIGTQSGEVILFDIRVTSQPVASLLPQYQNPKSVVSLKYVPRFAGESPGPGGLLVGQLDRSLFLEHNDNNFTTHYLSNDSVLMSLSQEKNTGHVLTSYRSTNQVPNVRHEVHNLVLTPKPPMLNSSSSSSSSSSSFYERVAYEKVRTFNGGTSQQTLARTTLMAHPVLGPEQLFVCTGDGSQSILNLWNVTTGILHQRLVGPEQGVSDICPINSMGMPTMLSAVGNKHLYIYRWTD